MSPRGLAAQPRAGYKRTVLQQTFCHLKGVGKATERKLWLRGLASWAELLDCECKGLSGVARSLAPGLLAQSQRYLDEKDADYFARRLPAAESWRLFHDFDGQLAYVDIETTGLSSEHDHITCIALYDGQRVQTFVCDDNLADFERAIADYKVLVTFNGKCFDAPVIERELRFRLPRAHIDLRYVLGALGYKGGLKRIEQQLGIDREDLRGVDGAFAVMLWQAYRQTGEKRYLDTLLAYNVEDVLHLHHLLVHAVNQRLRATPFYEQLKVVAPAVARNPFTPDRQIVERYRTC